MNVATSPEIIDSLIDHGAENMSTGLLNAATNKELDIAKHLIQLGADVNVTDNEGATPLIRASKKGNQDIVELLVENEADIHAKDFKGKTALHFASENGHLTTVEFLIGKMTAGGSAESDNGGIFSRDQDGLTAVDCASTVEIVKLLQSRGASITSVQEKLFRTCSTYDNLSEDLTKLLVEECGADINCCDEDNTPAFTR